MSPRDDARGAWTGPVPPEAPLEMPAQDLARAPGASFAPTPPRVVAARAVTFGGAALLTVLGAEQMLRVFDPEGLNGLQILLFALFTLSFGWIALSATGALAGLLLPPPAPERSGADIRSRTAIVMPVYQESPAAPFAALAALAEELAKAGEARRFELFVLSDSQDPDAWVRETTAFAALRARLPRGVAAWYRRRARNTGRKAGNVADFVTRWGGRYDFMLVLDADSLMDAPTVLEMVRRMEAAPRLGLLQSVPRLAGGTTLFARLQQFAGALYGPVVARGVASWQGHDGNFWGHNALIRIRAFARTAGLPTLPGRAPFGGSIMSHDFVEAALLRRAGWEVRMDPDLAGSWEGTPPSLADAALRDRRWAQGNLQHARVIGAAGLRWPSRAHFAIGIGSYLASPVWLAMLLTGLALTAQSLLVRPEYFPETRQLFPAWPRFDAVRMIWLFAAAMILLLLPKLIGLARALTSRPLVRAAGGRGRLAASVAVEVLLSALYAPVMMLIQCRQLGEILMGQDSGWAPQAREGEAMPWPEALRRHRGHALAGLAVGLALATAEPAMLAWLSPVLAGLVMAPLLGRISGSARTGAALARLGLLNAAEEHARPPVFARAASARQAIARAGADGMAGLARDGWARAAHIAALGGHHPPRDRGAALASATALAKAGVVRDPVAALEVLEREERLALLATPAGLETWARSGRRSDGGIRPPRGSMAPGRGIVPAGCRGRRGQSCLCRSPWSSGS